MKKIEDMIRIFINDNYIVAAQLETEALSYPVIGKDGDIQVDRFFVFSNQPHTIKPRPYAWLSVSSDTGKLLNYSHCASQDFAKDLKLGLQDTIDYAAPQKLTYKDIKKIAKEFAVLYSNIREFAFSSSLSEEQIECIQQYKVYEKQLIGEAVMPFYKKLSPEFYDWVESI